MRTIHTPLIITSLRAKVDGSIGISGTTPELNHEEKAAFFDLQNVELSAVFTPAGFKAEEMQIDKEAGGKSPSQRLRDVLFIRWKQLGEKGDFEIYYRRSMEYFINEVKDKLI